MNQRFEAFLAVAELHSMQKAADRQCVSYQCISGHIRSLEEEYHTRLFERKPAFALTQSGRILLESLQRIRAIEQSMAAALDDSGGKVVGSLKLGVPMSRYTEIVPPILARFKETYPNVDLMITDDYSNVLEQQVARGILDMAIVVQQATDHDDDLERITLLQEQYLFLVSTPLLRATLGDDTAAFLQRTKRRGITLREISQFPIVTYPNGSRLRSILDEYAKKHSFEYDVVFSSNRTETFDSIARTDIAGCIISQQLYGITERKNRHLRGENRLQVLRVNWGNHPVNSDMALIYNREHIFASYKRFMVQVIEEQFASYASKGIQAK